MLWCSTQTTLQKWKTAFFQLLETLPAENPHLSDTYRNWVEETCLIQGQACFLGGQHPERREYKDLAPFIQLRKMLKGFSCFTAPHWAGLAKEGFSEVALQLTFSHGLILFPSFPTFPSHRCWSQEHSLISLLLANFYPRVCFLGEPIMVSCH